MGLNFSVSFFANIGTHLTSQNICFGKQTFWNTISIQQCLHRPLQTVSCSTHARRVLQEHIAEIPSKDVVRRSSSSWSSPVVHVKKDASLRFRVDYLLLNRNTRKDLYHTPRINDALDTIQSGSRLSSLDLRAGYWEIPTEQEGQFKTDFVTQDS